LAAPIPPPRFDRCCCIVAANEEYLARSASLTERRACSQRVCK
jgi:hypothetical protein